MTNALVGDVYQKIIEQVIVQSRSEFEANGVNPSTLIELEREWKSKLTLRDVAHMPWQPKPEPPPPVQQSPNPASSLPSAATNGLPPYNAYSQPRIVPAADTRVKTEPGVEQQYQGMPNGYPPNHATEGGQVRAQQLSQQYMQARGLALPGQRPPGGQQSAMSPTQHQQQAQQMYMQQQRQQAAQQQAALQQQQAQPRIKVENDSPQLNQGAFQQQQRPNPAYAQTDGADDAHEQWQAMMVERRAATAETMQHADHMMRNHIVQMSSELQSGLMVPLDQQPARGLGKKRRVAALGSSSIAAGPSVPQLDGDIDEDEKPIKDEDDENAINSDLDSDNDPSADLDEDDEEFADAILCTYDKVQRVKNKWKCILKDGVMSVNRKEWVFHKGTGEFEW